MEGWLPILHGKKQFGCSRAKEKPQTSLLADMRHGTCKFKLSEKAIFIGACLHISNSFNIHRKLNIHVCLDLKLLLTVQAKTGPTKSRTRLFFQSGKPNEGCSQPFYDWPLLRLFLNKETLKMIFSQNSFARFHKLAATKDLYQDTQTYEAFLSIY